jgi:hypothetical protein
MLSPLTRLVDRSIHAAIEATLTVCSAAGSRATSQSLAGRLIRHGGDRGIRTAVPQPSRLGLVNQPHVPVAIQKTGPDKPMCTEGNDKGVMLMAGDRGAEQAILQAVFRASASISESLPSAKLCIALSRHSFVLSPITMCSPRGGSPSVSKRWKISA